MANNNNYNKQGSNIPWWVVVVGFMITPPLGIVLLILNLSGARIGRNDKPDLNEQLRRHTTTTTTTTTRTTTTTYNGTGAARQPGPTKAETESKTEEAQSAGKGGKTGKVNKQKFTILQQIQRTIRSGRIMSFAGAIMAFVFSIGFIDEVGSYGFAWVEDWLPLLGFMLAGLTTMGFGIGRIRLGRRQRLYMGAIGNKSSIFLSDLAATAGVSEAKVVSDIQKMLSDGTLPMGYIDRASGRLVLTDQGYEEYKKEPEKTAKVVQEATQEDKDRAILKQIQAINAAIPGEEMTRKIQRIEEITSKILAYARTHPSKSGELRQFLNYYLPTTLKILNAYAQMDAQGVEGENITAAKARIEGMMDKVVEGFEKQLDQLFQSDAMDITTDVEVLERMLQNDGLSGSDEITLTLNTSKGTYQTRPSHGGNSSSATATQDLPE